MHNINIVNVAVIAETKKQRKLAKWGEMSISMLVFTYSEVGTGQKVIQLKLEIGTGTTTEVRRQQILRVKVARFVIPYLEGQEFVLPSLW